MSQEIVDYLQFIAEGVPWTLSLVFLGLALGFLIGLPLAIVQTYWKGYASKLAELYARLLRGTPLLVFLSLLYFGFFPSFGMRLSPFEVSVIALGIRSSAYQSQIFRSALISIDKGQWLAAESLGMRRNQVLAYVIIPQALRISIPSWINEYAVMLKDSSICFSLGVMEVLTRAKYVVTATGSALIPFLFAGFLYLILTQAGTTLAEKAFRNLKIAGTLG